jgi:ATP-dependent helicase HrpA
MSSLVDRTAEIAQAMLADQFRLRRRWEQLRAAGGRGEAVDGAIAKWTAQLEASLERRRQRAGRVPKLTFDENLPITARRADIADAIRENQVVILCGETGSGKSTQLPKICLELGRGVSGLIGHTQPRRIAARSVAARIAQELDSPLGRDVGFKIRFTDTTSPHTFIKLMTDGILLAESQHDRFLDQYDTLIIDEAHERSLNIDFLLGCLHRLLPKRRDLKLIITSATIDTARFAEHFSTTQGPAPVIEVSGRTYPVETRYRPLVNEEDEDDPDWMSAVLDAVDELLELPPGDILLFMPTERDIHETAKALRGRLTHSAQGKSVEILPLYARLSGKDQDRVFQSHSGRRIVIATNVAESSLTVPGIRYVVDPGTARISRYAPRSRMQRLPVEPISQASADQRQGRCGRVGPGVCIRLYAEQDYLTRERYTAPEIQRTNLAAVILQTLALNLGAIEEFPFLDPPKPGVIRDGYRTLFELGAIDAENRLTDLGRQLARLPVDPRIGRMIVAAHSEKCLNEVLVIAAALEVLDPRERPIDKQQAADEAHAKFQHPESDFLSYLAIWDFFHKLKRELSGSQLRKACHTNFLSFNRLREWIDVHQQLLQLTSEAGMKPGPRRDDYTAMHRSLLAGLLANVGFRADEAEYTLSGGVKFHLWPGSGLRSAKPSWLVAGELVETSRRYLRCVARINPNWLEELAAHLISRSHHDPHWSREAGAVMCFEKVTLWGLPIVARRRARYAAINPAWSREMFIRCALVEGDWETSAAAIVQNRALLAELEDQQAKLRKRDLLRNEDDRFAYYDQRIPEHVTDGQSFLKWLRDAERSKPNTLRMTKEDLLRPEAQEAADDDFPATMDVGGVPLPLEYHLEPGSDEDGVTLTAPREALAQLDPHRLGWLVPGLVVDKIAALIKSLPKDLRRPLVPAPDTAKRAAQELKFGVGAFVNETAAVLSRMGGLRLRAEDFDLERLPTHLRMNVRVVDEKGKTLATGRDLGALRKELAAEEVVAPSAKLEDARWNRAGITAWDFGELPEVVELARGKHLVKAFPALVEDGETVALRLLGSAAQAEEASRQAIARLYYFANQREIRNQVEWLPAWKSMTLAAATLRGLNLRDQLGQLIAARAFVTDRPMVRSADDFAIRQKLAKREIVPAVQSVANLTGPLFAAYHQARLALEKTTHSLAKPAADDVAQQLALLVSPTFLTRTPWTWLQHYPRYLKAIAQRLEKVNAGARERDRELLAQIAPRWRQYLARRVQHERQGVVDPELEAFRWMLEEFRVSLFAQQLGTSVTVSTKRLDAQWAKVRVE